MLIKAGQISLLVSISIILINSCTKASKSRGEEMNYVVKHATTNNNDSIFYSAYTNNNSEKKDGFYYRYDNLKHIIVTGTYLDGKKDGLWYNPQKLEDEPVEGYYEQGILKYKVEDIVFDVIKDTINSFLFFSPQEWLIPPSSDLDFLYAGVSKNRQLKVTPNFNITSSIMDSLSNSLTLAKQLSPWNKEITKTIEQDENHSIFIVNKYNIEIVFGVYIIKTKKEKFILTTMAALKDYSLYKVIFKTIGNSFRPL